MREIIRVEKLGKQYRLSSKQWYFTARDRLELLLTRPWKALRPSRYETFWALKDVSFEVSQGEIVGIIGRNGAGKSTLLKILSRITEPTEGRAILRGRTGSLLEVGTGFHMELTGRENIYFSGIILGMKREEVRRKFDEIVHFAQIEEFVDMPLKYYSSGMIMRLAFSVAAHLEPEILIIDEVLAVGDIEFQKKCINKMEDVSRQEGRTILFVSHQMHQIRQLCERLIWLDKGQVRMIGPTLEVFAEYEKSMLGGERNDSSQRFPHQKASFRRWWLVQPSGKPHLLNTFGPIEVVFEVDVQKPLRKVSHNIALMTMDGKILWGHWFQTPSLSPGIHALSYEFPIMPLPTGTYFWRIHLYDEEGPVDAWDALPLMNVELPNYQHFLDTWTGVMNLPHTAKWLELSPSV